MRDISKITKEELKVDWLSLAEQVDTAEFTRALDYAVEIVSDNLEKFTDRFPTSGGVNGEYVPTTNASSLLWSDWTSSFWTGMVWLAYELTGEEKFKRVGLIHSKSFRERYEKNEILDHHDIGFLYTLSCVAAYKLTGDEFSKETAVLAARKLLKQYMEKCGSFQQWGSPTDPENAKLGICIVDCCMNLPLLYWASQATGDTEFYEKAYSHIRNASAYMVRDNGAVHQNLKFDVFTGELLKVYTSQGDGDENGCWSRGQAWAIYGFPLSYLYTGDKELLEYAKICANYFLNRLQSDYCANWDFLYTDDKDQRDTSAVSTAACGLLELAKQLPVTDPDRAVYEAAAKVLISKLTENYRYTKEESSSGLLKAGVYAFKTNLCVNEPVIWGDYYYMEALMRLTHVHRIYW
ncbi:MAG: glycoside hydrolase family 88 protein [Lachnospiraceae bacterium]|nr:glycoside hydrolase family 88 protein [Lachnospiraceae bacterium]